MKVTVFSTKDFERAFLEDANNNQHELKLIKESLNVNTVDLLNGREAIITYPNDDVSATILEKLKEKGVKFIASRSSGVSHIDIDHAKELGIKLANAPTFSPYAVAEHAVGMMITLSRKYIEIHQKINQRNFNLEGITGFDIHGKTVGILGTGKIGTVVVKILNGFGCNLLLWDKNKKEELEERFAAKYVDEDTFFRESDIITVHLPLNEQTRHFINKKRIEKMKRGVMIINTARGAIVKTKDLIEGLKNGKIGSAGLDVYEREKDIFFEDKSDQPLQDEELAYLLANNNVFITGHHAFATESTYKFRAKSSFESLNKWEKGEEPENQL